MRNDGLYLCRLTETSPNIPAMPDTGKRECRAVVGTKHRNICVVDHLSWLQLRSRVRFPVVSFAWAIPDERALRIVEHFNPIVEASGLRTVAKSVLWWQADMGTSCKFFAAGALSRALAS